MIQFLALAVAAFGGGFAIKKLVEHKRATPGASSAAISVRPVDEFLEERSDGLTQFNRDTAISILGWLGSVTLREQPQAHEGVHIADLMTSADGSPPPLGTGAAKRLLEQAKAGHYIVLSRDIAIVGRPRRLAAWVKEGDRESLLKLAGKGGELAILITPSSEKVEPTLPPMPGYENSPAKGVPGEKPLPAPVDQKPSETLPVDLRRQIDDLLKKHDGDPDMLMKVARQLRVGGYTSEANLIETRAGDMRAISIARDVKVKGRVFVIPEGHPGAIALAKKLTGDGKRFADLLAQNPALSAAADGSVSPWTPGQVVRLPSSWSA